MAMAMAGVYCHFLGMNKRNKPRTQRLLLIYYIIITTTFYYCYYFHNLLDLLFEQM